jgi:hypothetical protein
MQTSCVGRMLVPLLELHFSMCFLSPEVATFIVCVYYFNDGSTGKCDLLTENMAQLVNI